jgi:hypothetical protein
MALHSEPVGSLLSKLYWTMATQAGVNPRVALRSLRSLPRFARDWSLFRRSFSGEMRLKPCLQDIGQEGGFTQSEYFWQDLIVAQWIFDAAPEKHVDVGSRVDGFVAHVASFREIEVIDVRPISAQIPRVTFTQADLMGSEAVTRLAGADGYCDSLSCLHVLEHFGLGRYGDPVDPTGYRRGFANLAALLKPGGRLYLSTPVGRERVEFNGNWVFSLQTIIDLAHANHVTIDRLLLIDGKSGAVEVGATELPDLADQLDRQQYRLATMCLSRTTPSIP